MDKILVSIIVPIFNTSKYLNQCMDSILNQTMKNIEIICIDDGSTDNSLDIIEKYAKFDNRIKIITKKNEGQGITRNIGIKESNGEYIAFVDSDDFIKEDMIEKLYLSSKKYDLDICMCKMSTYDDTTHEIKNDAWYYSLGVFNNFKKKIFNHKDTLDFTCEISVSPCNKLYKRSFLLKNNSLFAENYIFEDELFFYDVYLNAKKVSIIDENLYFYRINRHGSTVSNNGDKNYLDILCIFKLIRQKIIETGNWKIYKINFCNRFLHLILWRFSQTSYKYKEKFYNKLKKELFLLFKDHEILNNLNLNIRPRITKIIESKDYNDFVELDKNKLFSIVMACYNVEDYIEESVHSIISQTIGFGNNVELIFVDDGSTDDTAKICKKYVKEFPDNIFYYYQENKGQGAARNLGLKHTHGKYINFLDSDDKLSLDALFNVYNFFELNYDKIDFVSIPIFFFERKIGNHILNFKYENNKIINLNKDWQSIQLSASSSFFKSNLFNNYSFDENLNTSEDSIMINKILLNNNNYGVVKNAKYYYRKRFNESSTIDNSKFSSEFYIYRLKNYFIYLINYSIFKKDHIPKFIQYLLIYELQWIFFTDYEVILNDEELKKFNKYVMYILENINDKIIMSLTPNNKSKYFLNLKYNGLKTIFNKNDVILQINDIIVDKLSNHESFLDIIEIRNNFLYISGLVKSSFNKDNLKIILIQSTNHEKREYYANIVNYDSRKGNYYETELSFDFKIPLSFNEKTMNKIYISYYDDSHVIKTNLKIKFFNHARLSKVSNYSFYENYFIKFKNNSIYISNFSYLKMIISEISVLLNILWNRESYWTSAIVFRFIYLISFPLIKNRKIFLFMDRRDHADDNAEYLFKYALKVDDNIKKYFTVNKDSSDFNRLKHLKNVLPFYSIKQRLIYLFSDKIISSHPDESVLNPFFGKNIQLYSGLITSEKIFLQHGVTKDNVSSWLRKYDKNLSLLVTTSNIEKNSFLNYNYNFDENIIKVLGFPRFDNLKKNTGKKQILIMPSWRETLHNLNDKQFKKSEYYKTFYSLLNNIDLIDILNKTGYKIIFKLHPNFFKFIHLFENYNKNIIFDYSSRYVDLFNDSSLLITDYSSVAFDFAYIKKPVLYYQYSDDYNFKERYFDYHTLGFGDVVNNENDLIISIKKLLNNDCCLKREYSERIDNFFKFKDDNNCKRVYDLISGEN